MMSQPTTFHPSIDTAFLGHYVLEQNQAVSEVPFLSDGVTPPYYLFANRSDLSSGVHRVLFQDWERVHCLY